MVFCLARKILLLRRRLAKSKMLRSEVMMPMFRMAFLCFSSLLGFVRNGYVIMKILLLIMN